MIIQSLFEFNIFLFEFQRFVCDKTIDPFKNTNIARNNQAVAREEFNFQDVVLSEKEKYEEEIKEKERIIKDNEETKFYKEKISRELIELEYEKKN